MPPRTSSAEPTGRDYGECEGDEPVQTAASFRDQNASTIASDQCSNCLYRDDSLMHPTVVYQGGLVGSEEKVEIHVNKHSMDSSESDEMMMLTLSDEASVSSLEESYVEGDSWSTIDESDDEDSKVLNMLRLLRDLHSPDESDRIFIFTDEEVSPTNLPQEQNDFQKNIPTKVPGGKIVRKMRDRLKINGQKPQRRKGACLSLDLLHEDSFSSRFDSSHGKRLVESYDQYSHSLDDVGQDKSSGSSSAYSDQLLPRKYMLWSRLNSVSSQGLSDSDSFETSVFLSKAVKSMRRQRHRRHSVPATSLLDSTDTLSSVLNLDNVEIDSVSSWEDDSVPNDSDRLSVEQHITPLRTLLEKADISIRNNSRNVAHGNQSHASGAGFTLDSTLIYPNNGINSDISPRNRSGFANKAKGLLEKRHRRFLLSESSACSDEVDGSMKGSRRSNRSASLLSSAAAEKLVGNFGNAKKKDRLHGDTRTLVESASQAQYPIPNLEETEWASMHSADDAPTLCSYGHQTGSEYHMSQKLDQRTADQSPAINAQQSDSKAQTDCNASPRKKKPSLLEGYKQNESIVKEDCGRDSVQTLAGANETMVSKKNGAHSNFSTLEATHVIGWNRVKRKSKSKKKVSGGKTKLKRKRGDGKKLRSSCIQLNAVSLQSGTAPWSSHLIRSVTPISTTALDARLPSRSIAASLGMGQEADELLTILSESIKRHSSRNIDIRETPKMTCIRMTKDLCIPNFGLYVLQRIQHFKQSLFI